MAKKTLEALRKLTLKELQKKLAEKQAELREADFNIQSAQETDISKRRGLRREIAQLKTILNEKQLEASLENEIKSEKSK